MYVKKFKNIHSYMSLKGHIFLDVFRVNLYNDDCLNVFKTINDNSIDLIVSDIPYKLVSGGCTKDPIKIRATKFFSSDTLCTALNDLLAYLSISQ